MISKGIPVRILLILALSGAPLMAEEKPSTPRLETAQADLGITPVLEQEQPLGSLKIEAPPTIEGETPVLEQAQPLENLHLEIKEKKRLKTSSHNNKTVRDSNGKVLTMTEMKSPRKNKESNLAKQGKLTREQMDFRPKDKTEYAF
jgi:hypothetical protein